MFRLVNILKIALLKHTEIPIHIGIFLIMMAGCTGSVKNAHSGKQLSKWFDRTSEISRSSRTPTAGEDFAMLYDPIKDRIVLFGGKNDDNKNINEVWTFDLPKKTWTKIENDGIAPPASEDHSLIYDPVGYRMILYGGEDGPTRNSTWSFDLRNHRWRDFSMADAPRREDHTAIYDSQGRRMAVFGGQDNDALNNEIWVLDLDPGSKTFEAWQKLAAKGKRPVERYDHVAIYDSLLNRMVVYGGWDNAGKKYLDDTWVFYFDRGKWRRIKTKKSRPPRRRHAVSVHDSARNWFIVQGGFGEEGYLNDVWAFDLATDVWTNITPGPRPRIDHAAIYDPKSQSLVLYGGDAGVDPKFHDIWELQIQAGTPIKTFKEAGTKTRKKR